MSLGLAERQGDLLDEVIRFCDDTLPEGSVYALLHRERDRLFPDEMFEDLLSTRGRRSVPPSVVATVMVLQRLEGLSDREAVERYTFDARWRYAAGVGSYDNGSWASFAHTVLVDMRERLRRSERPDRVFEVALEAASAAGLVGRRRVLDSAPLYDAVATGHVDPLGPAGPAGGGRLRARRRAASGAGQRRRLRQCGQAADRLGRRRRPRGAHRLPGPRRLRRPGGARRLPARSPGGRGGPTSGHGGGPGPRRWRRRLFRIARRVAPDRVISSVDPDARHGHKSAARGFDGYKGHAAVDPDSEIITATTVTPGNAGDASVAAELIDDLLDDQATKTPVRTDDEGTASDEATADEATADEATADEATADEATADEATAGEATAGDEGTRPKVYGDSAYGTGEFQSRLEDNAIDSGCRTQPPTAAGGLFAKDRFAINLDDDTVRCPAGVAVKLRRGANGGGTAYVADACAGCPLRTQCTKAAGGRTIRVGPHEAALARARARQADPDWQADYRTTRPKVERKLAHLMRRRHGGRRARVRGRAKVDADFRLLAAAANLARLASLGLRSLGSGGWAVALA